MRIKIKRDVCHVFTLCIFLGGCTVAPKAPAPAPVEAAQVEAVNETREVLAILALFQRVQAASAEEQRKEYTAANLVFGKNKGDISRLKLAILLVIPNTTFHDEPRALTLLEQMLNGKNLNSPIRQLALLLQTQLNEKLRQVREEHKHTDALQQKLDALKTLEKSLIEREQNSRIRKK